MSEKTVTVCDVIEEFETHPTCRRLADGQCLICHIDGCSEHLFPTIYIRIGTWSPPKSAQDTGSLKTPVVSEELSVRICRACSASAGTIMAHADLNREGSTFPPSQAASILRTAERYNIVARAVSHEAKVFKVMMKEIIERVAEEIRIADAQIRLGGKPGETP